MFPDDRPAPAQQRTDARHQLAHAERLGQVVVGAAVEPEHLVHLVAPRGQHQDGHVGIARVAPDGAAERDAVEPGQHQVEHDEVEAVGRGRCPVPRCRRSSRRRSVPRAGGAARRARGCSGRLPPAARGRRSSFGSHPLARVSVTREIGRKPRVPRCHAIFTAGTRGCHRPSTRSGLGLGSGHFTFSSPPVHSAAMGAPFQ